MSLGRIARFVEGWWLDDAELEPLAACRIMLGVAFFGFYAQMAPSHDLLWGPEGIVRYSNQPDAPLWLQLHAGWLLAATLVGSAGLTLGLLTRPMILLLLAGHLGHSTQTLHFSWGWVLVAPVLLVYLFLSRSHHLWSLDAYIRRRRRPDAPWPRVAPAWPMRLFQVNAIAIYLAAAWHRIDDGAWLRGEMVFEAIAAGPFTRAPGLDVHLLPYKGWLEAICWYTWLVELAGPIFLWFRRTRPYMALLLITVHLGLELGAFVGAWQFMATAVLMTCLEPAWLRTVFEWPARRLGRPAKPSAGSVAGETVTGEAA